MSSFVEGTKVAYFSMEIGMKSDMPTYSGGLGVLAGEVIRSSADLRMPLVAVTLVSKRGYLKQKITPDGWQMEYPEDWDPTAFMKLLPETVTVKIAGRDVRIVSGADAWLNTPLRPFKASGTRGMKAPHNDVINFRVSDGWRIEGCDEGLTGWGY